MRDGAYYHSLAPERGRTNRDMESAAVPHTINPAIYLGLLTLIR